jgi:hypothetical protein
MNPLVSTEVGDTAGAVGISGADTRRCRSGLDRLAGPHRAPVTATLGQAVTPWTAPPP